MLKFFLGVMLGWLIFGSACHAAERIIPTCSWDKPGANPYQGDIPSAVDHYTQIPKEIRDRLKARMEKRDWDETVVIRRESIDGTTGSYNPDIGDMHFGSGVCHNVSRSNWKNDDEQRGAVYCDSDICILVPFICRNVSIIHRNSISPAPVIADVPWGGGVAETPAILPGPIGYADAGVPMGEVIAGAGGSYGGFGGGFGGGGFGGGGGGFAYCDCCNSHSVITTPVPEGSNAFYIAIGLGCFIIYRRKIKCQ